MEDLGFSDDPGSGADVLSDPVAFPSREDIVLEGAGFKVAASITSQVKNLLIHTHTASTEVA